MRRVDTLGYVSGHLGLRDGRNRTQSHLAPNSTYVLRVSWQDGSESATEPLSSEGAGGQLIP